jgi:MFS transporter, Spinster family, sphingosine-1-phosphate transporter
LHLNLAQGALLTNTAFLLGYFVTSPIFGYLGDRVSRRWLIAAGVFVWSLGTLFSGTAHAYAAMFCFRALVGFGEASFGTISPGWIADLFPPAKRNNAITLFYFAIPVGSAMGFIFGGWVAAHYGWRAAFSCAGYAGLFLAALLFLLREPARGATDAAPASPLANAPTGWRAYRALLAFPRYVLVVAGYTAQTFAMGGFAQLAVTFLVDVHHMKVDAADAFFGPAVAGTGIISTLAGGLAATRWQKRTGTGYAWVLALSAIAGAPVAFATFLVPSLFVAKVLLVLCMASLFLSTGPVNTLILETVPAHMRASSMAASIFAIHLFGDLWSPPLIGYVFDRWGDLRHAMLLFLPGALVVSAFFWCWLVVRTKRELVHRAAASVPASA